MAEVASRTPLQRPLKVWLFNPYGPLPDEGWRDYSYVMLGTALAQAGHDVIWWTSNFSHHFKTFRSEGWADRHIAPGLTVRLVPTPGYKRNIGIGRFARDLVFAWRSYRRGRAMEAPDVILTSESPLTFGYAAAPLAKRHGAALIYDQMDLWPELIVQALPASLRRLANAFFWPVYRRRRTLFNRLDGAIALAEPYLRSITDEVAPGKSMPTLIVYNGIDVAGFREAMRSSLPAELADKIDRPGLKAIFAGSLGPSYDVEPMIAAARSFQREGRAITIFIAGDGPQRPLVEAAAEVCDKLVYLGKLPPQTLPAVYARCDIGLASYSARSNVEMPDKFYDYTAAGLAIVNSLEGEVSRWIAREELGLQYAAGSARSMAEQLTVLEADSGKLNAVRQRSWAAGVHFDRHAQHAPFAAFVEQIAAGKR